MSDLFSVAGRIAVVTGGTSGIGEMIARGLAQAGARVYIVGRNADACSKVAADLSAHGDCRPLPGDLSTLAGIEGVAAALAAQESQLDILVNNAGVMFDQPIDSFTEEAWDSVVDLNLKSPFFLVQKLLPLLREGATLERPSAVINIGSVGGSRVGPRETYSYAAAKAGLHHMTKSLAKKLGPEAITVNAVAPGFFPSRMTPINDQVRAAVVSMVPRRRVGEPDDAAGAIIYLASPAGAFITGAVIPLDGGMHI